MTAAKKELNELKPKYTSLVILVDEIKRQKFEQVEKLKKENQTNLNKVARLSIDLKKPLQAVPVAEPVDWVKKIDKLKAEHA